MTGFIDTPFHHFPCRSSIDVVDYFFFRKNYVFLWEFSVSSWVHNSVCVQPCSVGAEHDPGAMGPARVAGVEHQRRALQRRRRRHHRRRQQPQHQPGHQVRLLIQQCHCLPHHQTVSFHSTHGSPSARRNAWEGLASQLVARNQVMLIWFWKLTRFPVWFIQARTNSYLFLLLSLRCFGMFACAEKSTPWTLSVRYQPSCRTSPISITCMASDLYLFCFEAVFLFWVNHCQVFQITE